MSDIRIQPVENANGNWYNWISNGEPTFEPRNMFPIGTEHTSEYVCRTEAIKIARALGGKDVDSKHMDKRQLNNATINVR